MLMVYCVSKAWSRNAPAYHDSSWLALRSVHIRRTKRVGTQEVRGLGGEGFAGFTWQIQNLKGISLRPTWTDY